MARRPLITQARGVRRHSTGTHTTRRSFDVTPTQEPVATTHVDWITDEDDFNSFDRMMRGNRAAGL